MIAWAAARSHAGGAATSSSLRMRLMIALISLWRASGFERHARRVTGVARPLRGGERTVSVVGLLTATIICLMLPALIQTTEPITHSSMDMAVRGLVAMVLIFNVYAVRQQIRLKKLCDDMNKSLKALGGR